MFCLFFVLAGLCSHMNSACWFPTLGYFQFGCNCCCFVFLMLSLFFSSFIYLWTGYSVWSWSQIFHIGTVVFFADNLARLILWYISIFLPVVHAHILRTFYSSVFSNSITKYLDLCCHIINDRKNKKSVTVCVASVIFAMRFFLEEVNDNLWCALLKTI